MKVAAIIIGILLLCVGIAGGGVALSNAKEWPDEYNARASAGLWAVGKNWQDQEGQKPVIDLFGSGQSVSTNKYQELHEQRMLVIRLSTIAFGVFLSGGMLLLIGGISANKRSNTNLGAAPSKL